MILEMRLQVAFSCHAEGTFLLYPHLISGQLHLMYSFGNEASGEKRYGCLLQASEDSLSVSYKFPAAAVKPGSYVSLVACYTNFSSYDRPWRKPNAMDFTVRLQQLSSTVNVSGLATGCDGMCDSPLRQCIDNVLVSRCQHA